MISSIFLSHNSKDKSFVRRLANDLKSNGVKTWHKVFIERRTDSSGQTGQPYINLEDITCDGDHETKITVFSVLKKNTPVTGASGSTGAML